MSDGRPAPQNIQDAFLNTVRRDKATVMVYLVNGAKLSGRIRSFDKFSVLLESGPHEQLIFKHAISTISLTKRISGELRSPAASDDAGAQQHAQPSNQSADSPES
jgi:host factor-I protein